MLSPQLKVVQKGKCSFTCADNLLQLSPPLDVSEGTSFLAANLNDGVLG